MKEFTYENQNNKKRYETYEWDNTWIDHANNTDAKRVLYIGDSISCGIRRIATELSKEEILFDGFGSSKGIDNPYLMESIKIFAAQQGKRNAILFNNGLHGWHLNDETEYKKYFEDVIKFLLDNFENTPLMIILTTYITNTEEKRVVVRNKIASEIAQKYDLPIIDLYTEAKKNRNYFKNDGVHFLKKGYVNLAKKVVSEVKKIVD